MEIFEPSMTFRLLYVSGGEFYADYLYFLSRMDVESYTWGAIKSLFH